MAYVLRRNEDGAFVADMAVSRASYTRDLSKAKVYGSIESAKRDACGNETACDMWSTVQPIRGDHPEPRE